MIVAFLNQKGGVGKTTTVGKLSAYFSGQGRSVLLGAVDTFRAGAIAQLKVWAERTGSQFVTGREAADPGAVAFDAVTAGKSRGVDVVLLDTAGRLHTKDNLMEELKKNPVAGILELSPGVRSLQINYDGRVITQRQLIDALLNAKA